MDQFDFDMGSGTSPLVQELIEAIRLYQRARWNVQLALNAVNHKGDTLTGRNVVHAEPTDPIVLASALAMDMLGPSVATTTHQSSSDTQRIDPNWGLGNEPGRPGMYTAQRPDDTAISPQSWLWRRHPSGFEGFDSLGIFNDLYPQQASLDPAAFLPTPSHPYSLPGTTPVPFVYPGRVWVAPKTPPPLVETAPLPPIAPITCAHAHLVCGVANNDAANAIEPEDTSPSLVASSSGGGYNRAKNNEERFLLFEKIRKTLDVSWTQDEVLTLRTIITQLKGKVPDVEKGKDYKKRAFRAYFKILQDIVGPHTDNIAYNKVLGNALAKFATQVDAPPQDNGKLYGVFRLNNR